MRWNVLCALAAGLFLGGTAAKTAESVRSSGLEFTVISNAVIVTNLTYDSVRVIQLGGPECNDDGPGSNDLHAPFGISVHLGEANSGVYISPGDGGCRADGRSMWGHAYGQVNGETNRLISSIRGTRTSWGNYQVEADLTPLGATSYTYQAWSQGVKTLHVTNRCAVSSIYTLNLEDYNPRVNPVFLGAGSPGVVIEFPRGTQFIAGESRGVGDRFMILAEGATNTVDHVSMVEIYGSANLPAFDVNDARIGMFGRPHKALGGVNWAATNGALTAGPFVDAGMDGMLVDFKNGATRWTAQTEPFALDGPEASLLLSAEGLGSSDRLSERYVGPAGFKRSNEVVSLHAEFHDLGTSNAVLRVFQSNVLAGTIYGPAGAALATLTDTNPLVTGWAVTLSNLSFSIAQPTDVTAHDGGMVRGDRFEFGPHESPVRLGHVNSAHVQAHGIPALTILSEFTEEAPVPEMRIQIEQRSPGLVLSWPYHRDFPYLRVHSNVTELAEERLYSEYRDFRWHVAIERTNAMQFFSLRHSGYYYITP